MCFYLPFLTIYQIILRYTSRAPIYAQTEYFNIFYNTIYEKLTNYIEEFQNQIFKK